MNISDQFYTLGGQFICCTNIQPPTASKPAIWTVDTASHGTPEEADDQI